MIFCLMMLAETEVISFEPNSSNRDHEMSGQWWERFDKLVREMELPGFIGNALYLKSELRLKQGRYEEAQQLISEVLQLSKKPGLAYLHEKAFLLQEVRVPREKS